MPSIEIITIGTEILLGEIVDTNARQIARMLREHGFDIYRTSSIGDNADRIAGAIREVLTRADIVITTGGLGPTIDDATREAVALAFGVSLDFEEELWQQVVERFARFDRIPTENNRRQAYLPHGAVAIENTVGTAPAFYIETDSNGIVICLPGVPREMEHLMAQAVMPFLRQRYGLTGVLVVRVLHTAGVGESVIDEKVADLETLSNPTVGLAAHSGQVDVRIAAKADTLAEADALIAGMETEVRGRLGNWVYGADDETLATVAIRSVTATGWSWAVLEAGLGGQLVSALDLGAGNYLGGQVLPAPPSVPADLTALTRGMREFLGAAAALGVSLYPGKKKAEIFLALITPAGEKFLRLPFGGPPRLAVERAVNYSLDLLRKIKEAE